jgi:hypothetical protein
MAQRAVRAETTSIDPVFFIPDGVGELQYAEGIEIVPDDIDENEFEVDIDIDLSDSNSSDDLDYADTPEVPQVLDIYSQTSRTNSAGTEVVDVVFDVTEVFGAESYEIRVVKT